MTRLLAAAKSVAEAASALAAGADIVDMSQAGAGLHDEIMAVIGGLRPVCAGRDGPLVKYVRGASVRGKTVGIIPVGEVDPAAILTGLKRAHGKAAVLETGGSNRLFAVASPAEVAAFISACHQFGLEAWIAGHLEPPDIPRLLEYAPDVLCLDSPGNEEFRALVPREDGCEPEEMAMPAARESLDSGDRILVRDFVLPVEIGAYEFERGKPQRVRFNVEAEVGRRPHLPQDMRDVFSYDIILDTIRALVASGHTALVETLAERTAQKILQHKDVLSVMVRVEKLDLGPGAVGVEIVRRRSKRPPEPMEGSGPAR